MPPSAWSRPTAHGAAASPPRWAPTAQRSQTLVRGAAHQSLQAEPDGIGVGFRPGCRLGVSEETLIDVEGLLHTDKYTIRVWLHGSSEVPACDTGCGRSVDATRQRDAFSRLRERPQSTKDYLRVSIDRGSLRLRTDFVLDALEQAIYDRCGTGAADDPSQRPGKQCSFGHRHALQFV